MQPDIIVINQIPTRVIFQNHLQPDILNTQIPSRVWLECHGENPGDVENLGMIILIHHHHHHHYHHHHIVFQNYVLHRSNLLLSHQWLPSQLLPLPQPGPLLMYFFTSILLLSSLLLSSLLLYRPLLFHCFPCCLSLCCCPSLLCSCPCLP